MTYKLLNTRELTLIADFWNQGTKAYQVTKLLKRSQETIYRYRTPLEVFLSYVTDEQLATFF